MTPGSAGTPAGEIGSSPAAGRASRSRSSTSTTTSAGSYGRPASPTADAGTGPEYTTYAIPFAVNNLRSWFAQGQDVGALLPVLQTYLGHSSIADTAYYLHLTAESYPDITARVQQIIGDVVPPDTAGPRDGH